MGKIKLKKQGSRVDRNLFYLTFVLTVLGLIAVLDASAPSALANFSDRFYYVRQQLFSAGVGIVFLIFFSRLNYKLLEKYATAIYFLAVVVLILVLIPGIGVKLLGAKRWIVIGTYSFQPSEFAKLALCIYTAKVASRKLRPLAYFIPVALLSVLIMLQPDLGTTLVVAGIGLSQIFMSGINIIYFFWGSFSGVIIAAVLTILSPYRRDRLVTFLQNTYDPLGKGYHIRQILYALGSGGFLGVGLGQSRQKYLFLPEAATDSIFAVIAEEVGFLGSIFVILLFAFYVYSVLKIVRNAPDEFSKIFSVGIVAWIGGQVFLNLGSMVALVPLTGIPLPFFSYGGSALIMVHIATGILLNISKYNQAKIR